MHHTLITGGAGFIGSHLVDALLATGEKVVVLDDLSTGSLDNIAAHRDNPNFTFIEGSILDRNLVIDQMIHATRCFHLAAALGVHRILEQPLQCLRINLHGTENVLEAALACHTAVVVASTSEVYGKNTADSLNENSDRILGSPLVSRWNYAAAKGIDESFAHAYWREHGLRVSISRFFNTVGPRQTGMYGMVVPNLVGQALRGEPITVHGDGQQTRCFSHVRDVLPALIELSTNEATRGQAYNMGGAFEISIWDLAQRIIAITGSTSEIVLVPYEKAYGEGYEDMRRRVPDNTKSMAELGFDPATGLDEIITSVAADLQERAGAAL